MLFEAQTIPYQLTNYFSSIVTDYLQQSPDIKPFFSFAPSLEGMEQMIGQKKKHTVDRELLVNVLEQQYAGTATSLKVQQNI